MTFMRDGAGAENRDGGCRIQAARANLGHEVARGAMANILKEKAVCVFVFSIRTGLLHGGPGKVFRVAVELKVVELVP
jgi:hypothetical protein